MKGLVFYLKEKLIATTSTDNQTLDLRTKEILMQIETIEIDLKEKFTHWGVAIKITKNKQTKNDFLLIFFTKNHIHSCVWSGYSTKFDTFNEKEFIKKTEEYIDNYNTTTKKFKK